MKNSQPHMHLPCPPHTPQDLCNAQAHSSVVSALYIGSLLWHLKLEQYCVVE